MNAIIEEDLKNIALTKLPWDDLRNKTILITGGGGFLASYLVQSLIVSSRLNELHIRVICVVRGDPMKQSRLSDFHGAPELSFIQHDISQVLPSDFPHADIIIHSASQASPKFYGTDPVGTLLPNSYGTMNLLNHAVKCKTEKFMFFSSGEIYGVARDSSIWVKETDYGYLDPMNVRSCYAESKRMGETMCVAWGQQHNLHTVVVRPFHTYGPGIALDDGRVFADFIADVVAKRDISLKSDGLAMRPFCYIADATVGFLTVLLSGKTCEAYNVGNPDAEISIKDLAVVISKLFPERNIWVRFEVPVDDKLYLKSPVSRLFPSIDKMKNLNWNPSVTIEEGFRRTIQSFL